MCFKVWVLSVEVYVVGEVKGKKEKNRDYKKEKKGNFVNKERYYKSKKWNREYLMSLISLRVRFVIKTKVLDNLF